MQVLPWEGALGMQPRNGAKAAAPYLEEAHNVLIASKGPKGKAEQRLC